jgi:hypothetical protein
MLQSINITDEPVGYVYTGAAGLVDIGHVRDNADMTFWIYAHLMNGEHAFTTYGGAVGVPNIPTSQSQVLALAGAIAYVDAWAHEISTWGDTTIWNNDSVEDFSAFSPEDMSSNIVGIRVATNAIQAGGGAAVLTFDQQMDIALAKMMTELDAQQAKVTTPLVDSLEFKPGDTDLTGKWYTLDSASPGNTFIRIVRRNFDGTPWPIAGGPTAQLPQWLNTTGFSNLYKQFLYIMFDKKLVDGTQVPQTSAYALGGDSFLQWATIPQGSIPLAANAVAGIGGTCLEDIHHVLITSGQFGTVTINMAPTTQNIIANMKDITGAIDTQFVSANKCVKLNPCVPANPPMDKP